LRGGNDSEGETKKTKVERWVTLPLAEVPPGKRRFDKGKGAFEDSREKDQILFYPVPSPNLQQQWPRVVAGGRFDYRPTGFLDEDGKPFAFKPDDQIVVYREVFNRNPDPAK